MGRFSGMLTAGFSTDTPVTVSVEPGRLVIEPVKG
ncbi:SymE family type I addiction module toxin [Kluyvera genomosp. 2]